MFSALIDSMKLFLQGKLFRNTKLVIKQFLINVLITVIIMVVLSYFLSIIWVIVIGGFFAGVLQPILFKNLKYA